MAIYDISSVEKEINECEVPCALKEAESKEYGATEAPGESTEGRGRFFSSLAARLFFFLLLLADLFWALYALGRLLCGVLLQFVLGKERFARFRDHAWLSLRRSLVCGISLFVALFSPSFGIMIACTYFLMYDKSAIEEVVPSSLQSQFKDFLPKE